MLNEVVWYHRERRVAEFGAKYVFLLDGVVKDENIINKGAVINRNLLSEKFVKELALLSGKYMNDDAKAIEVNQLANEILAARDDINNLKNDMAINIGNSINVFVSIKKNISELIEIN